MREHGQVLSLDLLAALLVFVVILFFFQQSWSSNLEKWNQLRFTTELEERAALSAELLAESPGFPANWSPVDVNMVGLATKPGILSPVKINALQVLDYNAVRQKLNLLAFQFFLQIEAEKAPNPAVDWNFGVAPSASVDVATVERKVLVQGIPSKLRFSLYR